MPAPISNQLLLHWSLNRHHDAQKSLTLILATVHTSQLGAVSDLSLQGRIAAYTPTHAPSRRGRSPRAAGSGWTGS